MCMVQPDYSVSVDFAVYVQLVALDEVVYLWGRIALLCVCDDPSSRHDPVTIEPARNIDCTFILRRRSRANELLN